MTGEVRKVTAVIDGLKLTMTGEQLIEKLNERIEDYEGNIRYYERIAGAPATGADDDSQLPAHQIEHEIARSRRQLVALSFIRDYIVRGEVYLLGEFDLRFADLLPDDDWLDCACGIASGTARYPETEEDLSLKN